MTDIKPVDESALADALRRAGARFAFLFGSRAEGTATARSDIDVAAWWGTSARPNAWDVDAADGVDLVVLDGAPLWLPGRVAQKGRVLFDDDPPARVRWQAETRLRYLDEHPQILENQRVFRHAVAGG